MSGAVQTWQPSTAYVALAVVIPTAFGGYTWRCTTPGTSGGTEPVWPDPSVSPTVADGSVVWSVGTGFRQEARAALVALVASFRAANPTIVRTVLGSKPRNLNLDPPIFYIGQMNERVEHANGVRTRTIEGFSAYLLDTSPAPEEFSERLAFAVDALTDLFTGGVHTISGRSIFQHTATLDTEVGDGTNVILPGVEFQFGMTVVAEGRN